MFYVFALFIEWQRWVHFFSSSSLFLFYLFFLLSLVLSRQMAVQWHNKSQWTEDKRRIYECDNSSAKHHTMSNFCFCFLFSSFTLSTLSCPILTSILVFFLFKCKKVPSFFLFLLFTTVNPNLFHPCIKKDKRIPNTKKNCCWLCGEEKKKDKCCQFRSKLMGNFRITKYSILLYIYMEKHKYSLLSMKGKKHFKHVVRVSFFSYSIYSLTLANSNPFSLSTFFLNSASSHSIENLNSKKNPHTHRIRKKIKIGWIDFGK